ncbi:MAG: hypothetical protein ACJA0V_003674, partial [Planctomycetota bacterium]
TGKYRSSSLELEAFTRPLPVTRGIERLGPR